MKRSLTKKAYAAEIRTGKAPSRVVTQGGGVGGAVEAVTPLRGAEAHAAAREILQSSDPVGSFQSLAKDLTDKELRYVLASWSHDYFARNYLKRHFSKPIFGKHHPIIFASMRDIELQKKHHLIIEGSREAGKSTLGGLVEPVRLVVVPVLEFLPGGIANDIGMQYLLFIGATIPNIKETMSNAYKEFEDNEEIKADFGTFYRDEDSRKADRGQSKDEWSKTVIVTNNGRKFRAFAKHGSLRSVKWRHIRPQFVYAEDLDGKDKDSKSMTAPVDDYRWFVHTLLPAMDSDKYGVIITGNDVADNSCIHMLLEHGQEHHWDTQRYPLYTDDPETDERTYLWPEYYGPEYITRKEGEFGSKVVSTEYGGKRVADENSIMEKDVQYFKMTDLTDSIFRRLWMFAGMDPAHKDVKDSDFTAIQNIGYDPFTHVTYVFPPAHGRMSQSKKIELIVELYKKWDWLRCGIEDHGLQFAIAEPLKEALEDAHVTLVDDLFVPVPTGGVNKKIRIARTFPSIKTGKIMFLEGDKLHKATIYQLTHLESVKNDDLADALEIAMRTKDIYVKTLQKQQGSIRICTKTSEKHREAIDQKRIRSKVYPPSDDPRDPGYMARN